jgi:hypothetical protein
MPFLKASGDVSQHSLEERPKPLRLIAQGGTGPTRLKVGACQGLITPREIRPGRPIPLSRRPDLSPGCPDTIAASLRPPLEITFTERTSSEK